MARKTAARKKPKSSADNEAEANRILKIWKAAVNRGLGSKRFEPAVAKRYEPRLRANVLKRLNKGEAFNATVKKNTQAVAADIGKVCAILTAGKKVRKDTFQDVFLLMRNHPACPRVGSGAGAWCNIPL